MGFCVSARHGRGRSAALLASSSCVALLVGAGGAAAACYTGPFPFTNSGALSCITVSGTSFSGNLTNAGSGVLSPGGIHVTNASTVTGQISNAGSISVNGSGIAIDGNSVVTNGIVNSGVISSSNADSVRILNVSTFAGGISNGATISARASAIFVVSVSAFSGGITNAGLISSSLANGVALFGVSTFTGGISNGGTISTAAVAIDLNGVSTFTGGISNAGTISAAAGAVELFSVSTFDGGVTNAGVLSGGVALSGVSTFTGGISNAGTISGAFSAIQVSSVSTFSGGITNTVLLSGGGVGVSGVSIFNGGISNAGTISAGGSAINLFGVSTFSGGITNAGLISAPSGLGVNINRVSTLTGGISNAGTISAGSWAILVSNVSTFSGGITNTGVINASVGIELDTVLFTGGHVVNTGTIIGGVTAIDLTRAGNAITIDQNAGLISGQILLSRHGDTLNIRGGTINGNVVGQNAGDTINFALGSGTFSYAAPYSMSNVSEVDFNSGTVYVDGSIGGTGSTININGGAIVGGSGTLGGTVTVASGGTLMPGSIANPLGMLNVTGSVGFNAGSFYAVHVAPSASSTINVTGGAGTATLNGGTVQVTLTQLGAYSHTYTILTAVNGVSGTFAGATVASRFFGTASLSYDADDAFLTLAGSTGLAAPAGAPINQQNVINGINTAVLGGANPSASFQNVGNLTGGTLLNALSQLSGQNSTGFSQGAAQAGSSFLGLLLNPYLDGRGDGFAPAIPFAAEQRPALPDAALAFARLDKANPRDATLGSVPQFRVWGAAYGGAGTIDGNAAVGSQKTTASDAAFAAGVDYLLSSDTTVGFALAGGGTSWGLDGGLGNGRSDMFQAGVNARHRFGDAYVAGALAYSFHDVTTDRTVTIAGTDMLQGRFQANGLGARFEGGYHVATPFVRLTPYGAVQVQSLFLPAYGETATAGSNQFALSFASQAATTTRTEIGVWFDKTWFDQSFLDHGRPWTFYGRLAWAHDSGNTASASAVFQALPGSNFIVNGAVPNADNALVTVGAKYDLMNGWSFLAKLDGEFSQTTSIYSGTAMMRKTW
jgi:uncharacterized protein with beta-barrel porin domain